MHSSKFSNSLLPKSRFTVIVILATPFRVWSGQLTLYHRLARGRASVLPLFHFCQLIFYTKRKNFLRGSGNRRIKKAQLFSRRHDGTVAKMQRKLCKKILDKFTLQCYTDDVPSKLCKEESLWIGKRFWQKPGRKEKKRICRTARRRKAAHGLPMICSLYERQ